MLGTSITGEGAACGTEFPYDTPCIGVVSDVNVGLSYIQCLDY